MAAHSGNIQIVKYLIEKANANINSISNAGISPLNLAIKVGNHEIV